MSVDRSHEIHPSFAIVPGRARAPGSGHRHLTVGQFCAHVPDFDVMKVPGDPEAGKAAADLACCHDLLSFVMGMSLPRRSS